MMFKKLVVISGLFFFSCNLTPAQELLIKDKKIHIDGVASFELMKDAVVRHSFYLNDTNGKQLLYFRYVYWDDDKPSYFEAYRANDLKAILFEEEFRLNFKRYMVKKLYTTKVMTSKGINYEKLTIVSQKIGKEFSRNRDTNLPNRH